MTSQDLRNSILQLAVQGKLVSQDSSDESAVELLKKITGSTNGIIIGDTDYDLPPNWCLTKLKNLIKLTSGQDLKPNQYSDVTGETPYITGASNIKNENVIINRWTNQPRSIARNGDLLISCKGTIGAMAYLTVDDAHIARQIMAVSISPLLCKDYVKFFIQTSISKLQRAAKSMIPGISRNDILELTFPLPPLAEQQRIVAKIEELLPLIERYGKAEERLMELNTEFLDKLRKSILQQAVQGKLTERDSDDEPASELLERIRAEKAKLVAEGKVYREKQLKSISDDDVPFDIPNEWEWCKLGELTRLITKGSSPSWQGVAYTTEDKGILFVTSENVGVENMLLEKRKYVEAKFNEMHPSSILQKGDLLTNIVGASIGRTALFDENIENANINQAVCIIRLVNTCLTDYLLMYLNSATAIKIMTDKSVDSARANLSLTSVTNLLVPLPPLAEQKRIVARVEELLAVCDGLK